MPTNDYLASSDFLEKVVSHHSFISTVGTKRKRKFRRKSFQAHLSVDQQEARNH
jgi:hypothetical protein